MELNTKKESDVKYPPLEPLVSSSTNTNENSTEFHQTDVKNSKYEDWKHPLPSVPLYVPTGLDLLNNESHLYVEQKVELLEAVIGFKAGNKYLVKNNVGEKIYTAIEEKNVCSKIMFGKGRPFTIRVYDSSDNDVFILKRPVSCSLCCIPIRLQKLEVYSPPSTLIGTVEEEWHLFLPTFRINNETGECVLRISGPFFASSLFCGERKYEIYSKDNKSKVGQISKHWGGIIKEFYTDADDFGISFPSDLDTRMKAVLVGACFLIDYIYYES